MTYAKIEDFVGRVFTEIIRTEFTLTFKDSNGKGFSMSHDQDCCEVVYLDDIDGDLDDLMGTPIITAEETTNRDDSMGRNLDSFTWTFYKFSTIRGYVTLRWLGESNGYYSESVDICAL